MLIITQMVYNTIHNLYLEKNKEMDDVKEINVTIDNKSIKSIYCTSCTFTKHVVIIADLFKEFCSLTNGNKTSAAFTVVRAVAVSYCKKYVCNVNHKNTSIFTLLLTFI